MHKPGKLQVKKVWALMGALWGRQKGKKMSKIFRKKYKKVQEKFKKRQGAKKETCYIRPTDGLTRVGAWDAYKSKKLGGGLFDFSITLRVYSLLDPT